MVKTGLDTDKIVSQDEWLEARKHLLTQEKEFTRLRDRLSQRRRGWNFKWLSSGNNDFNYDYQVSFTPEALENEVEYNYAKSKTDTSDLPGVSVFYQDREGNIFHTYSAYSRGIDLLNPAYNYLDLVPKGRDEAELEWPMAWVRYHDQYDDKSGNTRREAR
jgi:predicted dithiol-disulfide oxidoreductase (DUF899 family)